MKNAWKWQSLAGLAGLMFGLIEALASVSAAAQAPAAVAVPAKPLPSIVERAGRYSLLVDGEPYLMLGVQANNSSAWPAYLDKVWPAAETLHANTVELPIYWEQMEATQGRFDFSVVDLILKQAREHHLRLVLLWFGTWKNASSHYTPEWIKLDQAKYPFVRDKDGRTLDSPSPFSPARLEADKAAFSALMRRLKQTDPQRTVLMVQVENEAGVWGGVRDYGTEAEKAFAGPVPEKLIAGLGKQPGTWRHVFGGDADETFQAWYIADYIEQVAAAGKREYPLPLYVNAALRDPFNPGKPPSYESGAPTDNNIDLWKIAAPSISLVAPDIYMPEYAKYMKTIELYKRKGNPLLIPETGNTAIYAHYVYAAIGQGAIGWAPFGLDLSRYSNQAEGPEAMESSALKPVALQYELLAPIARRLAKGNLEDKLRGASEDPDNHTQTLAFERWQAVIQFGMPPFGNGMQPKGNSPPDGGVVILQLGPDEFLVAGHHVRVDFNPTFAPGMKRFWLKVQEGSYDGAGNWKTVRLWNGDQTDYGLNLKSDENVLLKVRMTTF
jgi:beta-galactosidase GanA